MQSPGYTRPGKANRKRRIFLLSLLPAVVCRTTVVKRKLRNELKSHRFRLILSKSANFNLAFAIDQKLQIYIPTALLRRF